MLDTKPSIEDTIELFTLNHEQAVPFAVLAQALLNRVSARMQRPACVLPCLERPGMSPLPGNGLPVEPLLCVQISGKEHTLHCMHLPPWHRLPVVPAHSHALHSVTNMDTGMTGLAA